MVQAEILVVRLPCRSVYPNPLLTKDLLHVKIFEHVLG